MNMKPYKFLSVPWILRRTKCQHTIFFPSSSFRQENKKKCFCFFLQVLYETVIICHMARFSHATFSSLITTDNEKKKRQVIEMLSQNLKNMYNPFIALICIDKDEKNNDEKKINSAVTDFIRSCDPQEFRLHTPISKEKKKQFSIEFIQFTLAIVWFSISICSTHQVSSLLFIGPNYSQLTCVHVCVCVAQQLNMCQLFII